MTPTETSNDALRWAYDRALGVYDNNNSRVKVRDVVEFFGDSASKHNIYRHRLICINILIIHIIQTRPTYNDTLRKRLVLSLSCVLQPI